MKLTKVEKSWVMYDWANSVHSIIISTAIFPLWFGQIARNGGLTETQATFRLGSANTIYAIIIAAMALILGTVSDFRGFRRRLFILFWLIGIVSTAALVFVGNSAWAIALILYIITYIGFAGANVFYDASLPDITSPERLDMVSSLGFGWGYIGGSTIPFLISLAVIAVMTGMDLSGGLPYSGVKFAFALTAIWWLVFSFPYLKDVKQKNGIEPVPRLILESIKRLVKTFMSLRKHRQIFIFLLAYFFYIDGVNTIIKMATNFADSIGVGFMILLLILVGIQILAFPFAILYGILAQRFGARRMIYCGIIIYSVITGLGTVMPLVPEVFVTPIFFLLAFLVASSQGGIQALSRSYYANLIPGGQVTGEFFGLYNMMGKFAAILGPFLMGSLPRLAVLMGVADERRAYSFGVGAIFLLFLVGGILLHSSNRQTKGV